MARLALILSAVLLAGCASPAPQPVKVPVLAHPEPPAELLTPIVPPIGVFVAPASADAVACLAPVGRDALVSYVDALRQRLGAWEAWAR